MSQSQSVHARNLREGEAATLPTALQNHGMPYLVPEWAWAVESSEHATPFALIVCSFCHGWLVLFRVLALSPLPPGIPLTWFLEAVPQVFAEARERGCVGFLTFLADNRPEEVKIARIIAGMPGATLLPFQGSIGTGVLPGVGEGSEYAIGEEASSAH